VKGEASITHFTAGTRHPYWSDALEIRWKPLATPSPRVGVKPMSRITANASANIATSTTARRTKGTPRFVTCAM
jgi:hypothetical protein